MTGPRKHKALDPGHVFVADGNMSDGKRRMTCACGIGSTMEPEALERCRLMPREVRS